MKNEERERERDLFHDIAYCVCSTFGVLETKISRNGGGDIRKAMMSRSEDKEEVEEEKNCLKVEYII